MQQPNQTKFEILSHWHPNLTINLVDDHTAWTKGSIPSPLDECAQRDTEYTLTIVLIITK